MPDNKQPTRKDSELTRLIPKPYSNVTDPNKERAGLLNKQTQDLKDEEDESGMVLIIAFLAMIVFQLGNRIFGRLLTYPMHNYAIYMNLLSAGKPFFLFL